MKGCRLFNRIVGSVVLLIMPFLGFTQGWERVFPGAFSSFGNQVFVEADSSYLVHSFFDSSPRLMTVSQQGYETGATNVSGGLLTGDIITTMDGQLASADNLSTASPSDSNDVRISKFDRAGNTIWQYTYGSAQQNQRVSAIVQGTTGHYAFAGGIGNPSTTTGYVACIDEAGNELWHTGLFGSFEIFDYQLAATPDGGYFVAGSRNAFNNSFYMAKLDQNGNVEWNSQDYQGLYVRAVATTTDGNIAFIGEGNDFTWLVKIAPDGTELWLQEWPARYVTGLVQTNDGGFAYLYEKYESNGISKIGLVRTDSNGNELWEQEFYSFPGRNSGNDLKVTPDGGFIIVGSTSGESLNPEYSELYLIKTDAAGNAITNVIEGFVKYDLNEDCLAGVDETGFENWVVAAQGSTRNYYGLVDELGFYRVRVDTGTYEVQVNTPSAFWVACEESIPVAMAQFGDTVGVDMPVQSIGDCPLMEVNTSASRFRLCEEAALSVQYCNQGTTTASTVTVDLSIDEDLEFLGATIPVLSQNGDTFTFDVGAVGPLECGNFTVNLMVGCDIELLGQSLCTEAHIYPDTTCLPVDPSWSGASIQASAYCEGDEVKLQLKNVGIGNMQEALNYLVVEDDVIMMIEPYTLESGDSIEIALPGTGAFYRIESPQVPFHPGFSMPSAHVEACVSGNQSVSTGFVGQFPLDDSDLFVDLLCKEVVAAYDPNQKSAEPNGYQEAHFINNGETLEYFIEFQNTGTDTARKVVLQDILSPHLDPGTFKPGAGSHSYEADLSEDGVLTFTFEQIMLPDSNVNWLGSQGYVTFEIEPKPNLPIGTVIENQASIVFDFNPPIATNTTYHTIGEDFVVVDIGTVHLPTVEVLVYPNPFYQSATFEVKGLENKPVTFQLFTVEGRKVREAQFRGPQFQLDRRGLSGGFYFYVISQGAELVNTGKIVVH